MRPCSVTSCSVTPAVFRTARRLPILRGLASVLACLLALPLCLPFAQAAHANAAPARSTLATVLELQRIEAQAKAHPALLPSRPANRLANTPYNAPRVSAPAPAVASAAAAPASTRPALLPPASVTLLNDVGKLPSPLPPATVAAWKRTLHTQAVTPARAALLHLWLGEWELAQNEQLHAAALHLRMAQHLTGPRRLISGTVAYDTATTLFYQGAYEEAADAFARLLSPKTVQPGYARTDCALWLRHARACAGFHADRSRVGIPEPPRLDPNCGAAALAASLQGVGLPSDFKTVRAACRVTGFGSSLTNIIKAGPKLGVRVRTLTATDAGLMALPKPLVSFVEGDHFIAVVRADAKGVSYLCSDCGPWPGGRVNLTWKQWHLLEPGIYAAVTKPGSVWDQRLAAQGKLSPAEQMAGKALPLRLAMNGPIGHYLALLPRLTGIRGVTIKQFATHSITCGYSNRFTSHCLDPVCCPTDSGGPGGKGNGKGTTSSKAHAVSASTGDPVNLATGEEEYTPPTDLTVYNPHGPSVEWGRIYNSLRSISESGSGGYYYDYETADFGYGWSHPYNVVVLGGVVSTGYIVEPNGAQTSFANPSAAPTASHPSIPCQVQAGYPALVTWDYDTTSIGNHYTVTWPDRTRWIMAQVGPNTNSNSYHGNAYQLSQIIDRNGNHIDFHYVLVNVGYSYSAQAVISAITNQDGTTLLAIQRDGKGGIASVTDCYGRQVSYHVGDYGENIFRALDFVSQIVPAGTPNPPARFTYGYQSYANIEGYHPSPFLHTIGVPSPTGSGTSTATINYNPQTLFVSSLVDANGNTHTYTAVDYLHTKVTVADKNGNVAYSYVSGFDNNMSQTGTTDGAGHLTSATVYGDPNDPFRPSSVADGNANQSYPHQHAQAGQTASLAQTGYDEPAAYMQWDIVSPAGAVLATNANRNGWNLTLGVASGGLTLNVTVPAGTAVGAGYEVRYDSDGSGYSAVFDIINPNARYGTTAYTWDSYGNMVTETSPRGTVTTKTWDYSQFALGELKQVSEGDKAPTAFAYYEPSGLMKTLTTPAPNTAGGTATVTTSWTYDNLGNILTETMPGNNAAQTITTTFGYTTDGSYSQTAAIGQPLTSTDNLGKVTHFRYDSRGNSLSMTDAIGNETDFTYNIADQPLQTTSPATGQQGSGRSSSVSAYLYSGGPLLSATSYDESGAAIRQVNYAYGSEGEMLGVSGSAEPVTYTYDSQYRLSTLTDGGGHTTRYYYKQQGYLDAVTYPGYIGPAPAYNATLDGYNNITGKDSIRFSSYDRNGNVLMRIDGNSVETDYTYSADPQSLLTLIHYVYPAGYTGGTTSDVSLAYDAYGRRAGMTDGTGSQSYAYDDADDALSVTTGYTGLPVQSITYGYYPDGSRQSMSTPAGSFSYSYDAVGRMTGLSNPFSEASSWGYQDNNWLSFQGDTGIATYLNHTARGELHAATNVLTRGNGYAVFNSTRDGVGNATTVNANLTSAPATYTGYTYNQYDTRNQLTQEQSQRAGGYTNTFGYDGGTVTGAGDPTTFRGATRTFNADNQDAAGTYDGNGNPAANSGQVLAFDPESRLTRYGNRLACGYTGEGLRAWKQGSSGRTYFLYDGSEPVCELDSTGAVTATNTFGVNGLLSRHTGAGSAFYACDLSGNVAQRATASGVSLSADQYDAFGARQSTSTSADVFGFAGQWGGYTDAETGLVLMTHRYYDPNAGRFITRDPIGYNGGINLYAYTENNPVVGGDPTGLSRESIDSQFKNIYISALSAVAGRGPKAQMVYFVSYPTNSMLPLNKMEATSSGDCCTPGLQDCLDQASDAFQRCLETVNVVLAVCLVVSLALPPPFNLTSILACLQASRIAYAYCFAAYEVERIYCQNHYDC